MSKKIKIMHVAQSAGGVFKYLETMLKYTDSDKYQIILVLSEDYIKYKTSLMEYVDSIEIVLMKRAIDPLHDYRAIKVVRELIKKYNPDLIYAHSSKAGAITRIACITNKIPVIYNAHGWSFNIKTTFLKRNLYAIIEKVLAYRTTRIVNISAFELKSAISRKIAPKEKMKLIYNGIAIDTNEQEVQINHNLQSRLNKYRSTSELTIIGSVGRISKQKSPLDFVELASKVIIHNPNCLFLWVGDGEDRTLMEQHIAEKKLKDYFIITGWVDNPRTYIKQFDIALLLSEWEGFGLVLAEYMIEKKAIIATNVDAIPELIEHDVNGFIIDVHDMESACKYVINYMKDLMLLKKHGEVSYAKAISNFNINRVVKEHNQLYKEILGE